MYYINGWGHKLDNVMRSNKNCLPIIQSPNYATSYLWSQGWVDTCTYPHDSDFKKPGGCQCALGLTIICINNYLYDVANNLNCNYCLFSSHFTQETISVSQVATT